VARHEALRTWFGQVGGEPVQVVGAVGDPRVRVEVPLVDLSGAGSGSPDGAAAGAGAGGGVVGAALAAATGLAREPFDLGVPPLVRVRVFRLGAADHVLAVTVHHSVADGWSMRLFFSELAALYAAFGAGRGSPLPVLPIQYADYALWQRELVSGAWLEEQLGFWRGVLAGAPVTEVVGDRPRPAVQTFVGATRTFELSEALCARVRGLAAGAGATMFMALLAGFAEVVRRYSGQRDLVLGTYTAGRSRVELESLIGFFVNTVVLRLDLAGDPSYLEALGRVRQTCLGAFDHQDVPFEKLVEALAPPRDLSRNPLCQIAFQLVSGPAGTDTAPDKGTLDIERGTSSFDLVLSLRLHADGASGRLEANTDLYDERTIAGLVDAYRRILDAAAAEPDRPLSGLDVPDDASRPERGVGEGGDYPTTSLRELFDDRVALDPDAVALLDEDGASSTYGELRSRADAIARVLADTGVRRGSVVAVLLPRSPDWVATVVAVATLGATYLPLDPTGPVDRLGYMAEDAAAVVLVGSAASLEAWTGPALPTVDVRAVGVASDETAHPDPVALGPEEPAFLIYTSGSTGRPKGVVAPLRQLLGRLHWMWSELPFAPGEVQSARTPTGFIDSLWEVWGGLLAGVPTALVPASVQADTDGLLEVLRRTGSTRVWMVPSLLRALLSTHPELGAEVPETRLWVVSGEHLPADLAQRFHAAFPEAELINVYGTSEVWDATWHRSRPGEATAAIGRPLPYVGCYVADEKGFLLPRGAAGELWVGGDGVALGYLGRGEDGQDPFVERPDWGAGLCYRTGDRVRWNSNGELEHLGRLDQQVKIRGVRVEPGDVEAALADLPGVSDVAVAANVGASGFSTLVAYVVPDGAGVAPTMTNLRQHLAGRVPAPATPTALVVLDCLPRTSCGKLDRRALPAPAPPSVGGHDTDEPSDRIETVVQAVWAEIMDTERIGVHDNFFDLGGHSLLATQIVARLRQLFSIALPLQSFFETPTVAGLSALLGQDPRSHQVAEVVARVLEMTDTDVASALAADGIS
jgi:amino acid adenylation domain-containing protein